MTTFITLTEELHGLQPGEKLVIWTGYGFQNAAAAEYSAASGEPYVYVTRASESRWSVGCYLVPVRLIRPWVDRAFDAPLPAQLNKQFNAANLREVNALVGDDLGSP